MMIINLIKFNYYPYLTKQKQKQKILYKLKDFMYFKLNKTVNKLI